ncbi:MAG: hypothetical protein U9O56_01795 [Campylobacterota bacterium]|nr:hypothetical protein [Campylobacterota bacterium]
MIERFLTSGFEFGDDEHEQKLKYMLFNALLSLNIIVVFLASIARLLESNMVQFTIDILYCSSGLIILLLTRKYKDRFQLFVKIVMILSFIIVSLSFYFGMNSTVGTSWFVILLLVVVFLTDKKFSYFILLSSVAMIFYIFWIDTKHGYSLSSAFYSIIPLCVSCIFLYFYEKRNQTSKDMLLKQNKQLSNLTNNLQKLVDEEVEKNRKQFEVLAKQSQSAALGEMMDAIAHQWKQPLGTIKLYSESLAINASYGLEVTNEDIENSSKNINTQISHLINTIDEFRSFFRPNPELINVKISEVIDSTLLLMKDNLIQNQIEVETNGDKQLEFRCIPNESLNIFL